MKGSFKWLFGCTRKVDSGEGGEGESDHFNKHCTSSTPVATPVRGRGRTRGRGGRKRESSLAMVVMDNIKDMEFMELIVVAAGPPSGILPVVG